MKKKYFIIFCSSFLILAFLFPVFSYSQDSSLLQKPTSSPLNAGFDVIILKNGDIIYGLVKEVGLINIRYKRTDIPDGPIYVIPRNEVYAISYRNQVKDYLVPVPGISIENTYQNQPPAEDTSLIIHTKRGLQSLYGGNILVAIGFIRGFSDVSNASSYTSTNSLPVLTFAYERHKNKFLRFGIQLAVGAHKFTKQSYSSYDSAQQSIVLKENILLLHIYGKYALSGNFGAFQPYVTGGIGPQYSNVRSENTLQFINNTNQSILSKSAGRSFGIGILLRAGAEYKISDQLRLMADAGIGPSVVQVGIVYNSGTLK